LEQPGLELADDAGSEARRLAGVVQGLLRAREARLEPQGLVERLDGALRRREPALDDRGEPPPLVRQLAAVREVDARDLEEGDTRVADGEVVTGGLDDPRQDPRAQNG